MAALQIKNFPQELLMRLKMAALSQDKTLSQFVIDALATAALPPVVIGGTDLKASTKKR